MDYFKLVKVGNVRYIGFPEEWPGRFVIAAVQCVTGDGYLLELTDRLIYVSEDRTARMVTDIDVLTVELDLNIDDYKMQFDVLQAFAKKNLAPYQFIDTEVAHNMICHEMWDGIDWKALQIDGLAYVGKSNIDVWSEKLSKCKVDFRLLDKLKIDKYFARQIDDLVNNIVSNSDYIRNIIRTIIANASQRD